MKHLELIQGAITRMGTNNASLKGYCMAMVAAVIGLAAAVSKEQILIYTLPVILGMSVLDATYLALEKGFRQHYDCVRKRRIDCEPDFEIRPNYASWLNSYLSWSVAGFYGAVALGMIVISRLMPEVVKVV